MNSTVRNLSLVKKPKYTTPNRSGRVIQCFLNTDLRGQHNGLGKIAKKGKVDVGNLEPGQFVVFINRARNRIKVFASDNVIAYFKSPDNSRIDFGTIAKIPRAFRGPGHLDYNSALKDTLLERLGKPR